MRFSIKKLYLILMQKIKGHSGLSRGEKKYALKMVLLDMMIVTMILSLITFFIVTLL
jgi:hypothetical protein